MSIVAPRRKSARNGATWWMPGLCSGAAMIGARFRLLAGGLTKLNGSRMLTASCPASEPGTSRTDGNETKPSAQEAKEGGSGNG